MEANKTLDELAPLFGCAVVMVAYFLSAGAKLHDLLAWAVGMR